MIILRTKCDDEKPLWLGIQKIPGINRSKAFKICSLMQMNPKIRLKQLSANSVERLQSYCGEEANLNLKFEMHKYKKRLLEIKHYRGIRLLFGLPVRGQRSRTNGSTAKQLSTAKKKKKRNKKGKGKPKYAQDQIKKKVELP